MKFRLYNTHLNKYVGQEEMGLTFIMATGQLYSGNMNVTERYIIERYTGFKDANEKEIFEGDIFKQHFSDDIGVVRYGEYNNFDNDGHGSNIGFFVEWSSKTTRKDLGYWKKYSIIEKIMKGILYE